MSFFYIPITHIQPQREGSDEPESQVPRCVTLSKLLFPGVLGASCNQSLLRLKVILGGGCSAINSTLSGLAGSVSDRRHSMEAVTHCLCAFGPIENRYSGVAL